MKTEDFDKIKSLIKKEKRIQLRHSPTAQWIGDSSSLYPFYTLPELSEETLQSVLSVKDSTWEKYTIKEYYVMELAEDDIIEGETQLERVDIIISWKDKELIPLIGDGKIYFLQTKYIKPFDDEALLSFWLRPDPAVLSPMIKIQEGMLIGALVMPTEVKDKELLCTALYQVYELTKREVYGGSEI